MSLLALAAVTLWAVAAPGGVAAQDVSAAEVRVVPDYRMGSGDKIRVITFGEEALTGEFFVGGSGNVSLPLVGEVKAAGL
ncbi:polysaccharide biosynthesis/export family protein, partial [Phenylobacterium sp.]